MNIRDPGKFKGTFWDWTFLNPCFGETTIRVSDIDGIVERNGYVLFIETKLPNATITYGQHILHRELVRKGFSVLVIWGHPNKPVEMQIWYPFRPGREPARQATEDDIKDIVTRWFNWANANGNVSAA